MFINFLKLHLTITHTLDLYLLFLHKDLNNNNISYDKVINDYNEVKSLENKLPICFDYEFKKNEIIKDYLIIGHLLVFLYFLQYYFKLFIKLSDFIRI